MKNYEKFIAIGLVLLLGLSYYMIYDNNKSTISEYNTCITQARKYAEEEITVDAIKNYQRALEINSSIELYMEIADYYMKIDMYDDGIIWGKIAIQKYPLDGRGYEFLGKKYLERKDYNELYVTYNEALKRNVKSDYLKNLMNERSVKYAYLLGEMYTEVKNFSEGFCPVSEGEDMWGYVNEKGTLVLRCRYKYAGSFMEKVAPIMNQSNEMYFIDWQGNKRVNIPIKGEVESVTSVAQGLYSAKVGEKFVSYSKEGKEITSGYDAISTFGNGVAAARKNDKWVLIDVEGKQLSDLTYDDVCMDEKGVVFRNGILFVKNDGCFQMIDKHGNKITNEKFMDVRLFNDTTFAAVMNEKNQWFFVNNKAEKLDSKTYEDAHSFSNGYAAVKLNSKWGFINEKGELIINCEFDDCKDFNSKESVFVYKDGVWRLLKLYRSNYQV